MVQKQLESKNTRSRCCTALSHMLFQKLSATIGFFQISEVERKPHIENASPVFKLNDERVSYEFLLSNTPLDQSNESGYSGQRAPL